MQRNMDNGKADEDFQRLVGDPLGWIQTAKTERAETPQAHRSGEWGFYGGSERDRTVDLAIFSRSLYQLSYGAEAARTAKRKVYMSAGGMQAPARRCLVLLLPAIGVDVVGGVGLPCLPS